MSRPAMLVALAMSLVACAFSSETEVEARRQAVVYGESSYRDVAEMPLPERRLARSVALVVERERLTPPSDGASLWTIDAKPPLKLHPAERWAGRRRPGFCSAFLIAPDLVATAAHCLRDGCEETAFVFEKPTRASTAYASDVFTCAEVIEHGDERTWRDFAVVRLDRPAVGFNPLPIRRSQAFAPNEALRTIGYPLGADLTASDGRYVGPHQSRRNPPLEGRLNWHSASIDSMGGNSGGPVFDADGHVVGLITQGHRPPFDEEGRETVCDPSEGCRDPDRHWTGIFTAFVSSAPLLAYLRPDGCVPASPSVPGEGVGVARLVRRAGEFGVYRSPWTYFDPEYGDHGQVLTLWFAADSPNARVLLRRYDEGAPDVGTLVATLRPVDLFHSGPDGPLDAGWYRFEVHTPDDESVRVNHGMRLTSGECGQPSTCFGAWGPNCASAPWGTCEPVAEPFGPSGDAELRVRCRAAVGSQEHDTCCARNIDDPTCGDPLSGQLSVPCAAAAAHAVDDRLRGRTWEGHFDPHDVRYTEHSDAEGFFLHHTDPGPMGPEPAAPMRRRPRFEAVHADGYRQQTNLAPPLTRLRLADAEAGWCWADEWVTRGSEAVCGDCVSTPVGEECQPPTCEEILAVGYDPPEECLDECLERALGSSSPDPRCCELIAELAPAAIPVPCCELFDEASGLGSCDSPPPMECPELCPDGVCPPRPALSDPCPVTSGVIDVERIDAQVAELVSSGAIATAVQVPAMVGRTCSPEVLVRLPADCGGASSRYRMTYLGGAATVGSVVVAPTWNVTSRYIVDGDPTMLLWDTMTLSAASETDAARACRVGVEWSESAELPLGPVDVTGSTDFVEAYPTYCQGSREAGGACCLAEADDGSCAEAAPGPDPGAATASWGVEGCYDILRVRAFSEHAMCIRDGSSPLDVPAQGALFFGFEPHDSCLWR